MAARWRWARSSVIGATAERCSQLYGRSVEESIGAGLPLRVTSGASMNEEELPLYPPEADMKSAANRGLRTKRGSTVLTLPLQRAPPIVMSNLRESGAVQDVAVRANMRSILLAMMKSFSCSPLIFLVCRETVALPQPKLIFGWWPSASASSPIP